jgi:putative spermidine/putrescine transport system ATP-binding protein
VTPRTFCASRLPGRREAEHDPSEQASEGGHRPPPSTTRLILPGQFVLAFRTSPDNFTGIDAETPDIRLTGLTKEYGEVVAVAGIDLEIAPGEFFTMLGPSGSGKTTTLRMIAGFEDPSSGTIELAGEDVSGVPPYDRAVNTVFQDYALFPHMTVGENVEYGLKVGRVGKAERSQRRDEALAMVRLPDYAGRKPGELSGGQRQRVALARAIVNRPKVLLLDEPLGALDLKLREQMQSELKAIQGEVGITFVYVTHDQDEALTMSDRIAVFSVGRIEQVSAPLELYEHPANEFVAGFVGVSNLIERDGVRMTVRPEKIELLRPDSPTDGLHTESGRIVDVAYAGMITRFTVQLDTGEKLQLVKQNVESASRGALPEQGKEVLVGWRPEHAAAVGGQPTKEEVAP